MEPAAGGPSEVAQTHPAAADLSDTELVAGHNRVDQIFGKPLFGPGAKLIRDQGLKAPFLSSDAPLSPTVKLTVANFGEKARHR